ncbi:MAG: arsenate reductase ArsC [Gammaproteobacteria bacterium]|nr:arsenate reductase ArsC [Gammaproteobacteria bacterium]
MHSRKRRVLFLCTGNSCRSQMAEGWAKHLGGLHIEARSAGIEAHGKNPRAIEVMREAGVDIAAQESKVLPPEWLSWADIVITVCGHADEHCPAVPPGKRKQHWPLSDPAKARGSDVEVLQTFRTTREEIRQRVQTLVNEIKTVITSEQ